MNFFTQSFSYLSEGNMFVGIFRSIMLLGVIIGLIVIFKKMYDSNPGI